MMLFEAVTEQCRQLLVDVYLAVVLSLNYALSQIHSFSISCSNFCSFLSIPLYFLF